LESINSTFFLKGELMAFLFGTVGTPISTPKKPGGTIGGIQQIATLGLGALELGWVQSVRVSEETCQAINKIADQNNVEISVHASYFINLNADEIEWPKSRQRLMDAAYYGALAGATDIIFHPGSYFSQPRQEVLKRITDRLAGFVLELSDRKINITLRPETMGKAALIGSLDDVLYLGKQIPGVQPCIDFAHLHARTGDGTFNTYMEWITAIDEYASILGSSSLQHLHIHLSGIAYSAKGERNHLPLEESDLNYRDLFRALHEKGCGGRIMCESPVMEEDALRMQTFWNELGN
jgi:deoxyribonuclease IV